MPLWLHQHRLVEHALSRHGSMWAADMGTGKTRAAIELMRRLDWPKTIVVAPATVVRGVWPGQLEQWGDADKRVEIIDGSVTARGGLTAGQRRLHLIERADILLINYESVWREPVKTALLTAGYRLMILDESHRIKAPGGVASRYLSRLASRISKRVGMTGTPMPNSPLDLYAQYRALDRSVFGTSVAVYKARYAITGGFDNREIVGWRRKDELRERYESIAVQVSADEVLSLPPTVDSTRRVTLGKKALRLAQEAEDSFMLECETGLVTVANALVKLLRLQQITSGFLQPEGERVDVFDTSKRDALASLLTDLGETHAVVFARFRHDLHSIHEAAETAGYASWEISGTRKQLDEWRDHGGVLAVQVQSGGLGIDLTAARTAVYYSLGFSLGDYQQSRARLHRPGQERSVNYVHLVAEGTIDARVLRALDKKQDVIRTIMKGTRNDDTHQEQA